MFRRQVNNIEVPLEHIYIESISQIFPLFMTGVLHSRFCCMSKIGHHSEKCPWFLITLSLEDRFYCMCKFNMKAWLLMTINLKSNSITIFLVFFLQMWHSLLNHLPDITNNTRWHWPLLRSAHWECCWSMLWKWRKSWHHHPSDVLMWEFSNIIILLCN